MKVLVTGANGFLGRYVVGELLRQNFSVRVIVRSKRKIEDYSWAKKVEIFEGDLRFSNNLVSAFSGVDTLIHLAASKGGDEDEQFESTVVGTERLMNAMSQSETRRLIFSSSLSVYDYSKIQGKLNEDTPVDTQMYSRDGYAITKIWQERVVRNFSKKHNWDLTVLRPGMVWGEKQEYPLVLSIPLKPFHFVIGPMKHPNLVHVKTCAKAIVQTVLNRQTIGKTFNIIDKEEINSWRFVGKFLKSTDTSGIRIPVPYFIAYPIIKAVYTVSKWILTENLKVPSIFIPCRFAARFKPFTCSHSESDPLFKDIETIDLQSSFEELSKTVEYGTKNE